MEHDGVKMLKINFALNFLGKIFGNIHKINYFIRERHLEGTKRSVYLRESPKMVEEPRLEIVR